MAEFTGLGLIGLGSALNSISRGLIEGREAREGAKEKDYQNREEARQNREEARRKNTLMNIKLQKHQAYQKAGVYDADADAQAAQLNFTTSEAKRALKQNAKLESFMGFDRFINSGYQASRLNDLLQNPEIKKMWGGANSIENFVPDMSKPQDRQMYNIITKAYTEGSQGQLSEKEGGRVPERKLPETEKPNFQTGKQIEQKDYFVEAKTGSITSISQQVDEIDMNKFSKRYMRLRFPDGHEEIRDRATLLYGTGYMDYQTEDAQKKELAELDIRKKRAELEGKGPISSRGIGLYEIKKADVTEAKKTLGTDYLQAIPLSADKEDPKITAALDILKKQQPLKSIHDKIITDTAGLITLGKQASGLTGEKIGIFDSLKYKYGQMISAVLGEDSAALAAYNQYNALFRNRLYGSQLTDREIEAYEKAYGSDNKTKLSHVVVKFKTSLTQLRSKLEIVKSARPRLFHSLMGEKFNQLDETIFKLEKDLAQFRAIETKKGPESTKKAIAGIKRKHPPLIRKEQTNVSTSSSSSSSSSPSSSSSSSSSQSIDKSQSKRRAALQKILLGDN